MGTTFASILNSNDQLAAKARHFVRRWFAKRIGTEYLFHDLEHTFSVTRQGIAIGREEGLSNDELFLLELALLFHDTGYANAYVGHEAESVNIARSFLEKKIAKKQMQAVKELILSTRVMVEPDTDLQKIARDADSAKAGQADFFEKAERLRKELEAVQNEQYSDKGWARINLAYLQGHIYHTKAAQQRYGPQKELNIIALERQIALPKSKFIAQPLVHARFFDRDLSWLSFNDRVLQEARDPRTPLLERLKFLAIYSSNLDEFYRVRVASLRSLIKLKKSVRSALGVPAEELLDKINAKALNQLKRFGKTYRNQLLPMLAEEGIEILDADQLKKEQQEFVRKYFKKEVLPLIEPVELEGKAPFIEDKQLYMVCALKPKKGQGRKLMLLNIPSDRTARFIGLPSSNKGEQFIYLDDVVRIGLPTIFPDQGVDHAHSIKLTRDADLYLNEEFADSVAEKVRKSLRKRTTGVPSRFLFDGAMPRSVLKKCQKIWGLEDADMIPGGRYHNFSDLFGLPISGHDELRDPPVLALSHPLIKSRTDILSLISKQDLLLHFPYQKYDHVVQLLEQAAKDQYVGHIYITLYRVASGSQVCKALIKALERGAKVTAIIEVQARFDEESNLKWGERLKKAGAKVLFGYEGLKVHSKICLIERKENDQKRSFAYLGTGNFNEKTATLYTDVALLTANKELCRDVRQVFGYLLDRTERPKLDHLLMAPLGLRIGIERLIDEAIHAASSGKKVTMMLKMNSLEDRAMIRKIYTAGQAGVKVKLIVRGICCLVPGVKGLSDNIKIISIVDRFLEHARLFIFQLGEERKVFLGSADLMGRNLDRRVEVVFPVFGSSLQEEVQTLFDMQWADNVKARRVNIKQDNPYRRTGDREMRAQEAYYAYLKEK